MLRFIIKRVFVALLTLAAIDAITFLVFFAVPSSPGVVMCGRNCTPEAIARVDHYLGVDKPLAVQFAEYNKGIVAGRTFGEGAFAEKCPAPCFGYSFRTHEPVTAIFGRALPVTASIVIGAWILWIVVGVSLGVYSALHRGTFADRLAISTSLVGVSMPVFFFALLLLSIFVFTLRILPMPAYVPLTQDPLGFLRAMILPWLSLTFVQAAGYARYTRSQMLETLSEDYIRTARAIGLSHRTVQLKHALRAAITPVVTLAGLDLGTSLGGVAITETIFGMHGIGWHSVQAVGDLNLPVVMTAVLFAAIFIVISNTAVDVLYAFIDPRVKLS